MGRFRNAVSLKRTAASILEGLRREEEGAVEASFRQMRRCNLGFVARLQICQVHIADKHRGVCFGSLVLGPWSLEGAGHGCWCGTVD